jgi:hypothetical protein
LKLLRPQTVRDVVVPISEPVTIVELRESMCCWPIGDPAQPDFRFCGAKKLPGEGPYCACHAGIAYQTQHNRRRGCAGIAGCSQAALILGGLYYTISVFELISDGDKHSLPLDLASFDK